MELIAMLDALAFELNPPRGDEMYWHVADLGGCDLATWARFKEKLAPWDAATLRKFVDGRDIENRHLTAIGKHRPDLRLGVRVAMRIGDFGDIEGKEVDETYEPRSNELIGHPDGVLTDALIEVKSTELLTDRKTWQRIVPVTPQDLATHYKWQAGAYALALNKPKAIVTIECRASGIATGISFNPKDYEAKIKERMKAVLAIKSAMPPPAPTLHPETLNKDGLSWLCKHCRYLECALNRRVLPEVERESIVL